ncbi:MAG: citrate/2-methylcitrate synthase [Oscillospiraceae bacterium]|nr:citrate/2-methylcitrate synthase [Oscillospiraceae bacterium]
MNSFNENNGIKRLCSDLSENSKIDPKLYDKFYVKRGLRNKDGTGVVAGITNICNVHGYVVNEGDVEPIDGELIYRGYSIKDLVASVEKEDRFGFEEIAYLLLTGRLPSKQGLDGFSAYVAERRELPPGFVVDMILKAPSKNIMNKLGRSVLALYSYDDECEDNSIENEMRIATELIAKLPVIMTNAYQAKKSYYENKSMVMHPLIKEHNTAETILSLLRMDRSFTKAEAQLLDTMLMLHAEHGGGNNSTFTCRVLTSSGTDAYSAYASAIGSLKGPRHGGANIKVMQMLDDFKSNVKDWENEGQVADHMRKVLNKQANDGSGLIYGMGHAVYTLSDPRAVILKRKAFDLAKGKDIEAEFRLLNTIERLTPELFKEVKENDKVVCANVDMYSGLVYKMLQIPSDLYTPLFAVSRIVGWAAHRIEEILTGGRIIRPAYKAVAKSRNYKPIDER